MPHEAERMASQLLKDYGHLKSFVVDPMDEDAARLLTQALEAFGCTVVHTEHSTKLSVTCPDSLSTRLEA